MAAHRQRPLLIASLLLVIGAACSLLNSGREERESPNRDAALEELLQETTP